MTVGPASGGAPSARRVARNTGVQLAGDVLSKLASLGFYLVMARELGERGFGDFTFAISVVLLIELAGLGTDLIVTREIARDQRRAEDLFWNVNAIKAALGSLGVGAAMGVSFAGDYGADVRAAVGVLAVAKMAEVLAKTAHSVFRGVEDMAPIARSLVLQRYSTAVIGIPAMLLGAGLVPVSLVYLAGSFLALAYISGTLARRGIRPRINVSLAQARRLAVHSLPLGLSWVFGAILARLDAVLLSLLKGNAAVGLYGAAYRMFEATLVVSATFGLAALPALSRLGSDTTPTIGRAYETGCKILALALAPVGAAFILFASPIIETLYGPVYGDAASALRLLGPAPLLDGFFILSVQVLTACDRRRVFAPVAGVVVAENALLNLLLIPHYSFDGSATAMTLSQATLTALVVAITVRQTGSVSWTRVLLAPAAGCAAMGAVAVGLGEGIPGLAAAVASYLGVAIAVERWVFPADLRLMLDSVRWRRVPDVAMR